MKLFELNNQTLGSNIFKEQDLPLDFSEVINYRFVKEDIQEGIPKHYQIIFFYGDALGFNIDSFNMTILQEDLQNNIPVAYASVNVLDERTEEVIDTIIYTSKSFIDTSLNIFYYGTIPKHIYVMNDYKGETFFGLDVTRLPNSHAKTCNMNKRRTFSFKYSFTLILLVS